MEAVTNTGTTMKPKRKVSVSKKEEGKDNLVNEAYAAGFYDCLSQYQILSKLQRNRLRDRLVKEGPRASKNFKSSRPSVQL